MEGVQTVICFKRLLRYEGEGNKYSIYLYFLRDNENLHFVRLRHFYIM